MASPESSASEPAVQPDRSSTESQADFESTYDFPQTDDKSAAPKAGAKPAADKGDPKPAAEKKEPEKAEPKADPKPEKPRHNEELVELALEFGATEAEIEQVTPARLKAWVRGQIAERRGARPEPKKDEPKDDVIEFELDGKKQSLKADDWDPNVVALLRSMQAQNKALAEKFEAQEKAHQQSQAAALWESVEDGFESLDAAIFGKGRYADLDQKSIEFQRRAMLYSAAGIQPTDTPKQVKAKLAAKAVLFGASPAPSPKVEPEKAEPDHEDRGDGRNAKGQFVPDAEAQKELKRWDDAALPPPTPSREPGPDRKLTLEEASDRAVAATMRKHGLVPNGYVR